MSKLQELARSRNSAKGRIKGLRNNIRGMLNSNHDHLTDAEFADLKIVEGLLDELLTNWDKEWNRIKSNL